MNAIEVNRLNKSYPGFLLENINFSLPQGSIMGLVGENGAGKSTIIKLIMDAVPCSSGSVSVLTFMTEHTTLEDIILFLVKGGKK